MNKLSIACLALAFAFAGLTTPSAEAKEEKPKCKNLSNKKMLSKCRLNINAPEARAKETVSTEENDETVRRRR